MKKYISLFIVISLAVLSIFSIHVNAATIIDNDELSKKVVVSVEMLDNGDYIETVIVNNTNDTSDISPLATNTITKTKNYKNSSGKIMWSVSIKGTFTYNGSTSSCTSCSHSTTAPGSAWSIKSSSSSRSGNSATAKAVATYKILTTSKDYPMSVTIKCSPNGTVS